MAAPQSFEEFLRKHGTPVDPLRFPPHSSMALLWGVGKLALELLSRRSNSPAMARQRLDPDELAAQVTLGTGETARIVIFEEMRVNAVAARFEKQWIAGIHHGFALTIPEIAIALWSDRRIAPAIGDIRRLPPITQVQEGSLPSGTEALNWMVRKELELPETIAAGKVLSQNFQRLHMSLCPVRRAAAAYTTRCAFNFLWRHEIAHILLGHTDFLKKELGFDEYLEVADEDRGMRLPQALSHFIEQQADYFAVDSIIGTGFEVLRHAAPAGRARAPIPPTVAQTPLAPMNVAVISAIGCFIVPLILQASKHFQKRPSKANSHPPLGFRFATAINTAFMEWAGSEFEGELKHELLDVVSAVSGIHPLYSQWLGDLLSPSFEAETERYIATLNETNERFGARIRVHARSHPSWNPPT